VASAPVGDNATVRNVLITSTPSTPAYSTGTANDLVLATLMIANTANITGFPSGYLQLTAIAAGTVGLSPSYFVPAPAGAQTASWTLNASLRTLSAIQGVKP
jgi:hypothetical protein